jgi:glycerol kinase
MDGCILSIDQGTTSSRAILFDTRGTPLRRAQREFTQYFPESGWVEHDPEEIWTTTLAVCREVLSGVGAVAAVGITNQRETTVVWERDSGRAIHPAIVWQDRRTAARCHELRAAGHADRVAQKTGLVLDPYFSATKIAWILDQVSGARALAERGRLAFGTIDSFLIWRLTEGAVHATDATNASRTLLYNIHTQEWDDELLELFRVPRALLPEVRDSAADFGRATRGNLGRPIPIAGVAGDQQAAIVGQCCFAPGMIKSTYGTGCFAMMNTGTRPIASRNGLLTTIAYRLAGVSTYALEGSIFVAGSAIQWLRDRLRLIDHAADSEAMARELDDNDGVYLVPAFVGLGAPHWNPDARGALFGLTRDTGPAHLVRAALEAVCYQTRDLAVAMAEDAGKTVGTIRVDGGMVANDWLLQHLADVADVVVERPVVTETTALGAAYLAGLQVGLHDSPTTLTANWQLDRRVEPTMHAAQRERLLAGWDTAVRAVIDTTAAP